jgi:two-component system, cell cycle sensor histidine kinase and response regulator CckA
VQGGQIAAFARSTLTSPITCKQEEAFAVPEEDIRQMRNLEALSRLAGGVAHEFNNLLTVITGYVHVLLAAHGPGDPDHDPLTHVQHAAERAAELVRQLVALSGQQMLHLESVDVNALILRLREVLRRLLGPTIHLHLDLAPSVPAIRVDAASLCEVLLELAANAREAMPSGGQLTVTTVDVPSARAVRLLVSDNGRGMDEETRTHLFEPFFTTKEVGQGTGLHLAAAYGTVRQCGGQLDVVSAPGQGTTFALTFPAAVV